MVITRVVAHGGEALAFGRRGFCLPDACGGLPPNGGTIVLRSADGTQWERHEQTGLESGAVNDVADTPGGLIAVGFVADRQNKPVEAGVGRPTDAAIWRSDDGLAWTEVAGLPVADGLQTIGVDGERIVAIGTRNVLTTVFWTSSDGGRTWAEASARGDFSCEVRSIGGGRVLTATHRDVGRGFDGVVDRTKMTARTWTSSAPAELGGFRPAAATWLGGSYVVLGFRNHADADGFVSDDKPVAFSSADGVIWKAAPLPAPWAGQTPIAVAATGHGTIVVLHALDSFNGPGRTTANPVWFGR